MVKRDTSFVYFWRAAGILFCLCELLLLLNVVWSWSSSILLEKVGVLFFLLWGIYLVRFTRRAPRHRQRLEMLRLHAQDTPLFSDQPMLDGERHFPVPVTLSARLSRGVYVALAIFWLLMLGLILVFQLPFFLALHILWWFLAGGLLLGVLVIGLGALACYQRIEATEDALSVQQGLLRKSIPWSEARLFAVINLDEKEPARANRYELSSTRAILRWTYTASGTGFALQPRDRQEYRKLSEALRAYIRARTGLMVRDLRWTERTIL